MIYVWSDLHIFHRKILEYTKRPFSSVEEMNDSLLTTINKTCSKNDILLILGDFAFRPVDKMNEIKEFVQQINPKIGLIRGNHDKLKHVQQYGFDFIAEEAYLKFGGKTFWLNHFPLVVHDERQDLKRPKPRLEWDIALFGHTHCDRSSAEVRDNWGKLIGLNVGVDAFDTPLSLDQILEML